MESADIVLMKSDPFDVVGAIELSRATLRKMHQNLWWAVGYNVVAFPLAAGVLYPFLLSPTIAAIAMSGSSAVVAINALMLKRTKLNGLRSQAGRSDIPGQPLWHACRNLLSHLRWQQYRDRMSHAFDGQRAKCCRARPQTLDIGTRHRNEAHDVSRGLALKIIITWLDAMLLEDAECRQSPLQVELAGVVSVPDF